MMTAIDPANPKPMPAAAIPPPRIPGPFGAGGAVQPVGGCQGPDTKGVQR
jgi:hypothetical protein